MTRLRTMCPMNCHPTLCGMLVDVEDGRLVSVQGDPDNPDSRGFLCIRGQASREIIDNPARLLASADPRPARQRRLASRHVGRSARPDRRSHARGRAATPSGPGRGTGSSPTTTARAWPRTCSAASPISTAAQWWNPTMICWGLGGFGLGLTGALETNTKEDMGAHAQLIVLWGANLASPAEHRAPPDRGAPARRPRRDDRRARDRGGGPVGRDAAGATGHATPRWRWR